MVAGGKAAAASSSSGGVGASPSVEAKEAKRARVLRQPPADENKKRKLDECIALRSKEHLSEARRVPLEQKNSVSDHLAGLDETVLKDTEAVERELATKFGGGEPHMWMCFLSELVMDKFVDRQVESLTIDASEFSLDNTSTPAFFAKGQVLVGMEEATKNCIDERICEGISDADTATHRVLPTCAIRCARGGKTTFLLALAKSLKERGYTPLYLTFNGFANVKRRVNEDPASWLYRALAHALLPDSSTIKVDLASEYGRSVCEKEVLHRFFLGTKQVVLLVDELNKLLQGKGMQQKLQEASQFIKDTFLTREGMYFVFTSHVQSTRSLLVECMEGESARGVLFSLLPVGNSLELMRRMDEDNHTFLGLSYAQAAFYGRIPSLIWSNIMNRGKVTSAETFAKVLLRNEGELTHLSDLLLPFLKEVLHGKSQIEMVLFRELTDGGEGPDDVVWIPCYIAAFLQKCRPPFDKLGSWLQIMESTAPKDGKAWEVLVAVAFGLRYMEATLSTSSHPWIGRGINSTVSLEFIDCIPEHTTLQEALDNVPNPSQTPALQLFLPRSPRFESIDLFAVKHTRVKEVVMVAQQKEGNKGVGNFEPPGTQPAAEDMKAWWLRGAAEGGDKKMEKHGWTQPSADQIDEFLGISLARAAPSTWRDA